MEIRRFTPDSTAVLEQVVELTNAARKVDAPFDHPRTPHEYAGYLRHGWDGEVPEAYAAVEDGHVVGLLEVHTSEWDNRHLAWLHLVVHPDLRRAGRGSRLLALAEARVRELGRTSIGTEGWDQPAVLGFAARHDLPPRSAAVKRRQVMADVDWDTVRRLHEEARGVAADYELLRIAGRTPEALLPATAELTGAINDAPLDDLDVEDEVFPVERVRGYEEAQLARDRRLYRVVARHRGTGALVGHTVVVVERERPFIGDQHDTSVVAAHRGHRLGLLLKADMLRWLRDAEPQLATLDTWNAESNRHMIAVNERLGYVVLARELEFQRDVRPA